MAFAAVIRDIAGGIDPQRQNITGRVPFNLMKSETLVWVMDEVEYHETVTRRERRGSSHRLSIRVARGVYYRPGAFRSRNVEWEETVQQDTGLLGFTTKHIYFQGRRRNPGSGTTGSLTSSRSATGSESCGTPRPRSRSRSEPGTGGSPSHLATNRAQI